MTKKSALSPWDLLCLFHGDRPWPLVAINGETRDIKIADMEKSETREQEAVAWATNVNAAGYGIYFGINPLKEPVGRKAKKEHVLEARWLWADCDPPDGLGGTELEAWRDAKLAELQIGKVDVPPPTLIVDSGRGLWGFWRLRTPEPVDGLGPQTDRVESFARGLARAFGADHCHNIERIARLPGFVNSKTAARARVLEYHAERDCGLEDLPQAPLRQTEDAKTSAEELGELIDDDAAQDAVKRYLTNSAPLAVEGKSGRETTMVVLQRCQDFGCSLATSIKLMEELWNDRCSPPWDLGEIAYTLRGLRRNDPIGCEHPATIERKRSALIAKHSEPIGQDLSPQGVAAFAEKYPLRYHGDSDDGQLKKWLVDKALPEVGVALLSGQWGSYKTFLAFDLVAAVMIKGSFAGRGVKRQGAVLFIAAEGQDEVRPRLQGVVRAKIQTALKTLSESHPPIDRADLPFAWCEQSPRLATGELALAELRDLVRKASDGLLRRTGIPLGLIVIDTLMSAAGFKDANDWAEAQRVMNLLRVVAREFGALVLVVDHFGKDENKGTAGAMNKEGAADAVLAALATKGTGGKVTNTRLALRKVRGGKQGVEIPYWTRTVPLGTDADGGIIDTLVIDWGSAPSARERAVNKPEWPKTLRLFRAALERCLAKCGVLERPEQEGESVRVVDRERVRDEFYRTRPADKPDTKRKAFERSEEKALAEGVMLAREIEFDGAIRTVFWLTN
jgi:AAA domain-containing protein